MMDFTMTKLSIQHVWLIVLIRLWCVRNVTGMSRECEKILHHIQHDHVISSRKPDLTGVWTSYRCEIRSGPEFLLRHYVFTNSTFRLTQYYYADPDCSQPIYALVGEGRYKLTGEAWSVPGGADVDYQLIKTDLIPYDGKFSDQLETKRGHACPQMKFSRWQPYQKQTIYNFPDTFIGIKNGANVLSSDFDCLQLVHVSFHELQLVRVERRVHHTHRYKFPIHKTPKKFIVSELFLGDVHTQWSERASYRPSSYQIPLKRHESPACGVCDSVANSNENYPPKLRQRQGTVVNIVGEWASVRCECRPHSMFLTRHLSFNEEKHVWGGRYQFFHDPFCHQKSFSVHVTGRYHAKSESNAIDGARRFTFTKIGAQVVPHDQMTVNNLNGYRGSKCGKAGSWKVDEPQDVTITHGCVTLNINLPQISHDLVKMELTDTKQRLFIGERPTGPRDTIPPRRPTSFQAPLVKCSPHLPVYLSYTKDKDRRHVSKLVITNSSTRLVIDTGLVVMMLYYCYIWLNV